MAEARIDTCYKQLGLDKAVNLSAIKLAYYNKLGDEKNDPDKQLALFEMYNHLCNYSHLLKSLQQESIELQEQIKRIKRMTFPDQPRKQLFQQKLVKALNDLSHDISENLQHHTRVDDYCPSRQQAVIDSPAAELQRTLTGKLKKLTCTADNADRDARIFRELHKEYHCKCQTNPGWENFGKAIAVICLTGLAFIAGAIAGFLYGNTQFPIFGSLAAIPFAFEAATEFAAKDCYNMLDIPKGAFKHCLTFKAPFYSTAKEIATFGRKFSRS